MAESQKYGKYVGSHFGWQCVLNLEQCPSAAHTWNKKPACKSCKVAHKFKKGEFKMDKTKEVIDEVGFEVIQDE